jgi:hypothetical protein
MDTLSASLVGLVRQLKCVDSDGQKGLELREKILDTLRCFDLSRADWEGYITHHPTRFTRNLISDGDGLFNLLLLVWGPNHSSEVHNHGGSQCFFRVMEGNILEERFKPHGDSTDPVQTVVLKQGDAGFICDTMAIHKMTNLDPTTPAMTLHIYIPGYDHVTIYETPLDQAPAFHQREKSLCFMDSMFGNLTNDEAYHSK